MEEQGTELNQEPGRVLGFSRARLRWGVIIVVLVGLGLVGTWLIASGAWRAWRAVASVDGARITRAELEEHEAFMVKQGRLRAEALTDPALKKRIERSVLNDLITRRILLVEAERLKIRVDPAEADAIFNKEHGGQPGESMLAETAKRRDEDLRRLREEVRLQLLTTRLRDRITQGLSVRDEDVVEYYEAHKQAFASPAATHLRLLIVESREEANRLRAQAMQGVDFGALVRRHSTGGGKGHGGDLGWVDLRMLPPAIAAAVASTPPRGITPVVEAKGRFYVVQVEGRRSSRQFSLAEVQGQIEQMLLVERKLAKFTEWLEERRRNARIEIYL